MSLYSKPAKIRFLSFVIFDDPDRCWPWSGFRMPSGHGQFSLGPKNNYKSVLAHRYAYEMWVGQIPIGLVVMHICDNGWCVNPHHLRAATQKENIHDALAKGRMKPIVSLPWKFCKSGRHRMEGDNIYTYPNGRRRCRLCRDEYRRKHYLRQES